MPKKRRFKVDVWDYERHDKGWFAVAEVKTGRVEISAYNVEPGEVEKLLLAMNKHGLSPLSGIGLRYFAGWRLYGGRDEEWDWLVSEGGVLPDDERVAWTFGAYKRGPYWSERKEFRVSFFNRELGPFALAMVMKALSKRVQLPRNEKRTGDLSEWRKREAEWKKTWPERWEKMRRFKKQKPAGYRIVVKNTVSGEEYESWADDPEEAEEIVRRVGEKTGYTPIYEFALFDTWRVGPFLVVVYPERGVG